jgi:hypothetical protein
MLTFDKLIARVTGSISYEEDFAFRKHKEELAIKVRSECLPAIKDRWPLKFAQVGLDSDGDVEVETEKGSLFITRDAVVATADRMTVASIAEGRDLQALADVVEELFKSRPGFRQLRFTIRFFSSVGLRQPHSPTELQQYINAMEGIKLFAGLDPSTAQSIRWAVEAREGRFMETLELNIGPANVGVRQSRESNADEFGSFRDFIAAVGAQAMLERLRPVFEPLIADPSKVSALSFRG